MRHRGERKWTSSAKTESKKSGKKREEQTLDCKRRMGSIAIEKKIESETT
jgi:hypothetical protein